MPAFYTTELDELTMKIKKEEEKRVEAQLALPCPKDSLDQVKPKPVDELTDRILKRFFGNVCAEFLEDKCPSPDCARHQLPDPAAVYIVFLQSTLKEIDEAYGVAQKFAKIFRAFVPLFAEMFIRKAKNFELQVAQIIADCAGSADTRQLLHHIKDVLCGFAEMSSKQAIDFIIKHLADSNESQDLVLSMIVAEGPNLKLHMRYLTNVAMKRTLPISIVEKIIATCISSHDPLLPKFCLDSLISRNRESILQLSNLDEFIGFQQRLAEVNKSFEGKLDALLQKIGPKRAKKAFE